MLKPRVQVRDEGGVLLAEFWDCLRLDPAPVQELRKEFEAHLRHRGRPDVAIDLSGVAFAGSAALGGFLALNRLARQRGGRMVFYNVDATVYEVFRVSKLEPLFLFAADKAAALAQVNIPPPAPGGEDRAEPTAPADGPGTGRGSGAGAGSTGPSPSPGGPPPLRRGRRRTE